MHILKVKTENSKLKSMVSATRIYKVKTQISKPKSLEYATLLYFVFISYSSMYLSML